MQYEIFAIETSCDETSVAIAVGDIYLLRDEYAARESTIRAVIKKFHMRSPTKMIISEDE